MIPGNGPDFTARLRVLRIIWFALLAGQLAFMAVIFLVIWPSQPNVQGDTGMNKLLFYIALVMLVTEIPVGFFVRHIVYGNRNATGAIDAARYATGNIILWACCEGAGIFGLVVML